MIKNVEKMSILEIAAEIDRLKAQSLIGLSVEDLSGGTITLSNIGNLGGTSLHPVLLPSQVCIGAIGKLQRLPRFELVDGKEVVVAKEIITASINADHRVVDGATAARFFQLWKMYLEIPATQSSRLR